MKRLSRYGPSSMVHHRNRPGEGLTTSCTDAGASRPCGDRHAHLAGNTVGPGMLLPEEGMAQVKELATEHLTSGLMAG